MLGPPARTSGSAASVRSSASRGRPRRCSSSLAASTCAGRSSAPSAARARRHRSSAASCSQALRARSARAWSSGRASAPRANARPASRQRRARTTSPCSRSRRAVPRWSRGEAVSEAVAPFKTAPTRASSASMLTTSSSLWRNARATVPVAPVLRYPNQAAGISAPGRSSSRSTPSTCRSSVASECEGRLPAHSRRACGSRSRWPRSPVFKRWSENRVTRSGQSNARPLNVTSGMEGTLTVVDN